MKKRIAIAITLVAAVGALAVAPLVMAGGRHAGFGHGFGGHGFGHGFGPIGKLMHVKEELDLSEQQVDQLKAIFRETREQNAVYREQLHGGYTSVAQTLLANPNDIASAQALVDQQLQAERALKTSIVGAASKALAVLNADQRAKLSAMIEEHAERHTRRGR